MRFWVLFGPADISWLAPLLLQSAFRRQLMPQGGVLLDAIAYCLCSLCVLSSFCTVHIQCGFLSVQRIPFRE